MDEAFLRGASSQGLQRAMDRNMAAFWAPYGRGAGAELYFDAKLVWFYTGIATPLFNGVVNADLNAHGVKVVADALRVRISTRGAPCFWWIGPLSRPDNIGRLLEQHGLKAAGSAPGMVADLASLRAAPSPIAGFEIKQVEGAQMRTLWGRIAGAGTGFSEAAVASLEKLEPTIDDPRYQAQRRYLGLLEGKPVACSALVLEAGVAGVYAVATLPEARRKGIGRTMTLAPLLEAREAGYRVGVLQSSSAGHTLYESLGFKRVCDYTLYLEDD
jgi:ribosomal protein S18 acetylase RimI-like enzyme